MALFDDMVRDDDRGRLPRERMWAFLNRCSRPELERVRQLLERWLAAYPEASRKTLIKRLKSRSDNQFYGAFFELYLFSLLTALGFRLKIPHSQIVEQKTEDFRVYSNDELVCLVEARFVGQEDEHRRQDAYLDQLYIALEAVDCPELDFAFALRGTFTEAPPARRIARSFEKWLRAHLEELKASLLDRKLLADRNTFIMRIGEVELKALPLCLKNPDSKSPSPIGSWMPPPRWLGTYKKLRKGLKVKATRYGKLSCPYVVAVAAYEDCDHIDLFDAFFGDEVAVFRIGQGAAASSVRMSRKPNGLWLGPNGPQNKRVSAILLVSELFPWSLARQEPVVYHNPWAEKPLGYETIPLEQMIPNQKTRKYERRQGLHVRDILGLPAEWPDLPS